MIFLYNFFIQFYAWAVFAVSFFNEKARKWRDGRKNLFQTLENQLKTNQNPIIWFHTASLGEFEQARPVIEQLAMNNEQLTINSQSPIQNSKFKILVTFFSPSGYEVRKSYGSADYVFYLPLDTPKNAKRFLEIVKPVAVFWVKYEFWYHHLFEIQKRKIPLILFSAVFRENQFFFKWYGKAFLNLLKGFTQIFVQNQDSYNLLKINDLQNIQVAGDTRFDRVRETAFNSKSFPQVAEFKNGEKLLVIGSAWEDDLQVLLPILNSFPNPLKIIIAPHEIKESKLQWIENQLVKKIIRYSRINQNDSEPLKNYEVLLIDNIGMLASLYQYGEFAYVGGAFKQGLHNILEPATFGIPVIFGVDYRKYPEAKDLIDLGGAFSIQHQADFQEVMSKLYEDELLRKKSGEACQNYISANVGSAEKVLAYFRQLI